MKPFNLEDAKKGKPVCTRDGHAARIICWDTKNTNDYPSVALMNFVALINFPEFDGERIATYNLNGKYIGGTSNSQYDLFMVEEIEEEHYDISNFKPFDKVLIRDCDEEQWQASFFSHYEIDAGAPFSIPFVTVSRAYYQCIPYNEDTQHLLGTTEMPPKKYINW